MCSAALCHLLEFFSLVFSNWELGMDTQSKESREARFSKKPTLNRYTELRAEREKQRAAYTQSKQTDTNGEATLKLEEITLWGTCLDMCPEFERHERELQNGLDPFEKVD